MARFIARAKGGRGETTRLGHARDGATAGVDGWHCGMGVWARGVRDGADKVTAGDRVSVGLNGGSNNEPMPSAYMQYDDATGRLVVMLSGLKDAEYQRKLTAQGWTWKRVRKGGDK